MTHDDLLGLIRQALRAARVLAESDALAVLDAEDLLAAKELQRLCDVLDSERILNPGFFAELSPVVAHAEQALAGETRTTVIDHDTGCDGETLERITELTRRGHRIAESVWHLRVLYRALAELHDAVAALRAAHRIVSGR